MSRIVRTMPAITGFVLCLLLLACLPSCSSTEDTAPPIGDVPPGQDGFEYEVVVPTGLGVGKVCGEGRECRAGLRCVDGTCQPTHESTLNTPCTLSAECQDGLFCGLSGLCEDAGTGAAGDVCSTSAECLSGLYCAIAGLVGTCSGTGDVDLGNPCEHTSECFAGLACINDLCSQGSLPNLPFWPGAPCQTMAGALDAPLRVYFEVPRESVEIKEFYRLPFPNDIRMKNGHPDLSGHLHGMTHLLGIDLVDRLLRAIEEDLTGWGVNQAITFRFSGAIDFNTVDAGSETPSLYIVDISPESPGYANRQGLGWTATTGRSKYLCYNYMAIHPLWSVGLRPATTFAAILTTDIKGSDGEDLVQDSDFAAMLDPLSPEDPELRAAWEAYAPFRAYLALQGVPTDIIAAAAVFTTQDPSAEMSRFRDAVAAADAPTTVDMVLCDQGASSPCDDGLTGDSHQRGCFEQNASFYELQGTYTTPAFQQGTPPFLTPEDGGGIEVDGSGLPTVARTEDACFSLTIPKGVDMPEEGWPLVLYAHGTGGNYRSFVDQIAELYSEVEGEGQAALTHFALLGIDGGMHGPRRGSELSPDVLFFNIGNPRAGRTNSLQAAADYYQLIRFAERFVVPEATSPIGAKIEFDLANIAFIGHSQGGNIGPLFLTFEPRVKGGVLSGAGGGLVLSVLNKTQPVNIAEGLKILLNDDEVDENHPALNLLQAYYDAVDPINYGAKLFWDPVSGIDRKHMVMTYGLGDSYTPARTMQALALSMHTPLVSPVLEPFAGLMAVNPPATGTANFGGEMVTSGLIQYQPSGYDGHFVMFRNDDARSQTSRFLGSMVLDEIPTIPLP